MGAWEWHCVILDESHKLATRRSTKAPTRFVETCKRVAAQARRVIMLSGCVRDGTCRCVALYRFQMRTRSHHTPCSFVLTV